MMLEIDVNMQVRGQKFKLLEEGDLWLILQNIENPKNNLAFIKHVLGQKHRQNASTERVRSLPTPFLTIGGLSQPTLQ